jgi:hypothetical protein
MLRDQKIKKLKAEITHHKAACLRAWPKPSDYTRLIDAQYALRALRADEAAG